MHPDQLKAEKSIWIRLVITGVLLTSLVLILQHGTSIWLNRKRPQLEQALTEATGLNAQIKGSVSASLFPVPGFSLGEIEMSSASKQIATARELSADFELRPLFKRQLVIHSVLIDGLALRLAADDRGRPALPLMPSKPAPPTQNAADMGGLTLSVPDVVELRDSDLVVQAEDGTELYRLQRFNLALQPVHPVFSDVGPQWTVAIHLNFQQARLQQLVLGPTQLTAQYRPGALSTNISKAAAFGGKAVGTVSWIDHEKSPEVSTRLSLTNIDAEQSASLFRKEPFIKGKLNLQAELSSSGNNPDELLSHLSGTVKLTGADLELISADLDELVTRVVNSQQYNLVDTAAYFFIGPLAASATKGVDVANVAKELKKPGTTSTRLSRLVSSWNIAQGGATAQDVALETTRYRLALQGRVDLVKREFNKVRIGVVNDKGCAIATQGLDGPFAAPRTDKLNILFQLARPLLGVLSKPAMLLSKADCEPFYKGELLPTAAPVVTDAQEKNEELN